LTIELEFEPNFQKRVLVMRFGPNSTIASRKDAIAWRQKWTEALKSWHSPYSAIIDASHLSITAEDPEKLKQEFSVMARFFSGLFLKKAAVFGIDEARGSGLLPFQICHDEAEASQAVGLREAIARSAASDFRSTIVLQNDFQRHVIEMSFSEPVRLEAKEHMLALKSKLTNILMQWHSKWSLLIDCANLDFAEEMAEEWQQFDKYFRGFFMKKAIGYSPHPNSKSYPFPVFRARHKAVAQLENEGNIMGDLAICRSRKNA
jgi:hypothetical protein